MGRELKRVPLDFSWPQGEVWEGYLNPYYRACPDCKDGYTVAGQWVERIAGLILLTGSDSVSHGRIHPHLVYLSGDFNKRPSPDMLELTSRLTGRVLEWDEHYSKKDVDAAETKLIQVAGLDPKWALETVARQWLRFFTELLLKGGMASRYATSFVNPDGMYVGNPELPKPSPEMVELSTGLAGRPPDNFLRFHDAIDRWSAHKAILKAAGVDENWGTCKACQGEAIDPAIKEDYEAWGPSDPPVGDGFQLWETTTEGSPDSPVFETLDSLCEWCEDNATTFGSSKASKAEWLRMLSEDMVYHQEGSAIFL